MRCVKWRFRKCSDIWVKIQGEHWVKSENVKTAREMLLELTGILLFLIERLWEIFDKLWEIFENALKFFKILYDMINFLMTMLFFKP